MLVPGQKRRRNEELKPGRFACLKDRHTACGAPRLAVARSEFCQAITAQAKQLG
jgi:hypothetical protein